MNEANEFKLKLIRLQLTEARELGKLSRMIRYSEYHPQIGDANPLLVCQALEDKARDCKRRVRHLLQEIEIQSGRAYSSRLPHKPSSSDLGGKDHKDWPVPAVVTVPASLAGKSLILFTEEIIYAYPPR